MAIESYIWRDERNQKKQLQLAWQIAMLSRQKRIPPLRSLLAAKKARILTGPELQEKRQDFKQMASKINIDRINKKMASLAREK